MQGKTFQALLRAGPPTHAIEFLDPECVFTTLEFPDIFSNWPEFIKFNFHSREAFLILRHQEGIPLATISAKDWPDFTRTVTRAQRRAFRRRLQPLPLNDQIAVWKAIAAAFPTRADECEAEVIGIRKRLARLQQISPTSSWVDDVAAHGGEFPPGRHLSTMQKARGEATLYPRAYIVSSGHSFDRYCDELKRSPDFDDGYRGSILCISELHPANRITLRRGGRLHVTVDGKDSTSC